MANERIEVEWIATANKMVQVLDNLNTKFDKQEKQLQKLGDTSKKAAEGAANSFNKLEQELKDNEAQLKKIAIGTKEFELQKKKVDALRQSLNGAKGELAASGGMMGGLFSTGIAKIAAMAAGMASFQAIVSAVVNELASVKQLRLGAAATTRTFEQALADVGQNIGAGAVPQAKQMILENAPKLGTTNEGLANLIGIAISAGAKDLEDAMALSAASLKLTVGDATKAAALVGGTLDIASLGGTKNYEAALGQALQMQSQVRSTNLSEFMSVIGPGLAAATAEGSKQKGVSTERGLEMASVISQIIKDPSGSNTATTMRYLFNRMSNFTPEREVTLDDGGKAKVSKAQIEAFNSLKTFDERLKAMQDIPAIGLQFLETQRESIGKTAISEIIQKSARAVEFEAKAKANITDFAGSETFFQDLSNVVNRETAQLQASRKAAGAIAAAQVTGDRDLEGTVIEIVDKAIAAVDLSGINAETSGMIRNRMRLGDVTGAPVIETGIVALQEAQQRRKAFGLIPVGAQVSEADKRALQEQIEILKQMRDLLAKGQSQPQPQKPAAPAVRPREAPLPAATVP